MPFAAGEGHLTSINNMRGLASVAVMLFHFIQSEGFMNEILWLKRISAYGEYGVQFFFIISGFVIPYALYRAQYSISSYGRFLAKRLIRLEPPYLVNILFTLVVYGLLTFLFKVPFNFTAKQVFLHLGYLNAFFQERWLNIVYWSLSVEFQYYLLIGLAFPLLLLNAFWRRSTLVALGTVSLFSQELPREFFFVHTPIFCLGISAFLWYIKKISKIEFYVCLLLGGALVAYTAGPLVLGSSALAVVLLLSFHLKNKILGFLGDISYSMYLNHILVGSFVISMTKKRTHLPAGELLGLFLAVCATLLVSYILYMLAEKPFQKLSSSIKYGPKVLLSKD